MADDTIAKVADGEKLTNWKKEPTLQQLKSDFDAARPTQQAQVSKIKSWNELLAGRGRAKPAKVKNRSSVQPKLIRRQGEWRYSALTEPLLGTPDMFTVKPLTFEDVKGAEQNGLVINHQFRTQINRVKFIDDYIRSTHDDGTSIIQVGWERQTRKTMVQTPVYDYLEVDPAVDAAYLQQLDQAFQLKTSDPRSYNEQTPQELKLAVDFFLENQQVTKVVANGQTTEVEKEEVIVNRPTLKIHDPANVTIDPACEGEFERATWVALSFETSKADLLRSPGRYSNLDKVDWSLASGVLNDGEHSSRTPQNYNLHDDSRKRLLAYEYWGYYDINDDGVLVPIVATWIGNTLIRLEESPFPDGKLPFVVVTYLPVKRELYGETDAELLEDNQAILGALMRGMIDLLGRSANSQRGFAKGMLDTLNKKRFEDGSDYEFNPNVPVQSGLIEHKYPELPQSAMMMLNLQNQEAEALTGVKSFAGGMSGNAYGEVAAGIRGVLDAASKREMAILRRLALGMIQIGQKIIAMNAVFLSEEETVRITNDEFVTVRREDLKGNFDVIVDISTAEVDNAQAENLSFMLQTLGNTVEFGLVKMILVKIAKLKRMPDLARQLEAYEPQPDPLEQKKKELEIAKLEAEIAELNEKAALSNAKALEAMAKAESISNDTEEKSSGVAHERAMEHVSAQAEANADLEITKGLLKSTKADETDPDIEAAVGFNELTRSRDHVSSAPLLPSQAIGSMIPGMGGEAPLDQLSEPFGEPLNEPIEQAGGDPRFPMNPALDPSVA